MKSKWTFKCFCLYALLYISPIHWREVILKVSLIQYMLSFYDTAMDVSNQFREYDGPYLTDHYTKTQLHNFIH